jgi:serine/threonine protein kinase
MTIIQNKYQIQQSIGQGKFGKVYLGQNIHSGMFVAVKTETKMVSLLKREATILRYLQDNGVSNRVPNLLWFGLVQDETIPCMVMTYCSGGTLTEVTQDIVRQCISVLEAIHTYKVIHRDVKPHNFMFDHVGNIRLIDFGLATFVDEDVEVERVRDTMLGTPRYASPHVHLGVSHTYRDDLISLGYVFLHISTRGEYPQRPPQVATSDESPESIHHPLNVEIARSKQLAKLRESIQKSNHPVTAQTIRYLEYCYSLSPKQSIDYTLLKSFY